MRSDPADPKPALPDPRWLAALVCLIVGGHLATLGAARQRYLPFAAYRMFARPMQITPASPLRMIELYGVSGTRVFPLSAPHLHPFDRNHFSDSLRTLLSRPMSPQARAAALGQILADRAATYRRLQAQPRRTDRETHRPLQALRLYQVSWTHAEAMARNARAPQERALLAELRL